MPDDMTDTHDDAETTDTRDKTKQATWDQEDVLKKKDGVTQSGRGLQIWGDELAAPTGTGHQGNASQGTAERAATITKGQGAYDTKQGDKTSKAEPSGEEGDAVGGTKDRSAEQPT